MGGQQFEWSFLYQASKNLNHCPPPFFLWRASLLSPFSRSKFEQSGSDRDGGSFSSCLEGGTSRWLRSTININFWEHSFLIRSMRKWDVGRPLVRHVHVVRHDCWCVAANGVVYSVVVNATPTPPPKQRAVDPCVAISNKKKYPVVSEFVNGFDVIFKGRMRKEGSKN